MESACKGYHIPKEGFMLKKILNNIDTTYEGYKNLKSFLSSVIKGEFKKRDAEMTQRFQHHESSKTVAPNALESKMESMEHSQGISGFSGSGYKGAGKAQSDKMMYNRPRH
jgi:hypothetical protein